MEKHPTKIFVLLRKSTEQDISSSECSLVFYSDCWSRTHPPAVKCQAPISCTSSWLSQWSEIWFPSQKTDYWHSEEVVKIGLGSVGLHETLFLLKAVLRASHLRGISIYSYAFHDIGHKSLLKNFLTNSFFYQELKSCCCGCIITKLNSIIKKTERSFYCHLHFSGLI